jgi:hypothetical protein
MSVNLVHYYLFHTVGIFKCRKILRHGIAGFTYLPKETVLPTSIALKSPSSSAWFEPADLGSSFKHDNQFRMTQYG